MPSQKTLIEEFLQDADNSAEFEQEMFAFQATEMIATLMSRHGVRRTDLARQIGKSKSYITQLLSGSRNMTFHTLAQLAYMLGYKLNIQPVPLAEEQHSVPNG